MFKKTFWDQMPGKWKYIRECMCHYMGIHLESLNTCSLIRIRIRTFISYGFVSFLLVNIL